MQDPEVEEVQAMIEFLIGRERYVHITYELCMIRRKLSFKESLYISEFMQVVSCRGMIEHIKIREEREIDKIIFEE